MPRAFPRCGQRPCSSRQAVLSLAVLFASASPSAAANCHYLHEEACAAPGPQEFLRLWATKLRCWLCTNITQELANLGQKLLKGAVASDLGVTETFEITRPWLDTCLPVYALSLLASTRSVTTQPGRLYEFGLSILWNCDYEPSHFFRLFGVTPGQIAYVFSLLLQRREPHPLLLALQRTERGLAAAALDADNAPGAARAGPYRPWDAPLVLDVGMGLGGDSRYYLQQGFRVVAVEANPLAVDAVLADKRSAPFLRSGQLSVLNAAVAPHDASQAHVNFGVLPRRPEQSKALPEHEAEKRARGEIPDILLDGGEEVSVRTLRCADLLKVFGRATYLKIDVESNTIDCLESLHQEAQASGAAFVPPRYISLEVEGTDLVPRLYKSLLGLGYTFYKVCRQFVFSPGPCEQSAYDAEVPGCGSGPFGEEAVDYISGLRWKNLQELPKDRGFLHEFTAGFDWFDLHAKLPD